MFDLGVENGTIISRQGRQNAHIYSSQGRIQLVSDVREDARTRLDASGLFVMPGMVDAHVHFMDPSEPAREDFPTGSLAAAAAGVTTVLEHTHSSPVTSPEDMEQKRSHLSDRSFIDFGLAAHALPNQLEKVEMLWAAGPTFLKAFTCSTHGITGWDYGRLLQLFKKTQQLDATCLIHCEDNDVILAAEAALKDTGRNDPGLLCQWRNQEAEMVSVAAVQLLARRTKARVGIAHISGVAALEIIASKEPHLFVESCPQYFLLQEDEVLTHGALRKFTPPARARSNSELQLMWQRLNEGAIDYIASDHAPASLMSKDRTIWEAPFGLPGVDTTLSVLLDAAASGKMTYEKVVEVYSEMPSRIYRLFPRKGSLEVGTDADFVLVDPNAEWKVKDEVIRSKANWSPFSGRQFKGRAVTTVVRGKVVVEEGRIHSDPGWGEFIPGPGWKQ